jgi:hypothetical protein
MNDYLFYLTQLSVFLILLFIIVGVLVYAISPEP